MSQQDTGASAPQPIAPIGRENFPLAIVAGVVAAAAGAVIWAVVTAMTQHTYGLVAILIGFVVGFAVQKLGKGHDIKYSIVGAACALVGSVVGNVLGDLALIAGANGHSVFDLLPNLNAGIIVELLTDVDFMTVVIYGIAVYEGWRFAVVKAVPVSPPPANTP